jgi:cytochrome c5
MYRLIAAAVVVLAIAVGGYTRSYSQSPRGASAGSQASYSKAQLERGRVVYSQYCSRCHLENLQGKCAENLSSATYVCGATGSTPPLVGATFMKRFYSVGDLYSRVRWTMPAPGENTLSTQDNLAVVAYILQANGVPAGQELTPGNALKTMTLAPASARTTAANVTEPVNSVGISHAYYTEAQAERGKGYFYGSCGFCHTADPTAWKSGTMDRSTGLGWHRGQVNSYSLFASDTWLSSASGIPGRPQRWSTVADLYNKIRTTQPAYDVAGLSNQAYLDMIAYLLKQNGLPAGKEELKGDLNQMRNMTLEKGFERLFNGKDLTGWKFVVGANCKTRPNGCGGDQPGGTFKIDNGTILNTGSPHGYMYTLKKYWNFTFRLEYKMDPYEGMESDDDLFTNTGYFLFVNEPHDVWPETMEIQGKNDFEMSLALGAAESTFKFDDAARARARKPAGQWNQIQIVSKDGQVWTYLNGALITHVTKHPFKPGYIALQVESGPVHWRNIRIRED